MTFAVVLISIGVAALLGMVMRNRWRIKLLLGISVLAVYAFQPLLPVRGLDFWLPTATLALVSLTWIITSPPENRTWLKNFPALLSLFSIVLVLGLTRYLGISLYLTASNPPQTIYIIIGLAAIALIAFLLMHFSKPNKALLIGASVFIILLFVILKVPQLSTIISGLLRSMNHQSTSLTLSQDLRWLGFSYIAFRLLHTIRDRLSGRLPVVSLTEYMVYVIFFPALTAGPIDRIERFVGDLRRPLALTSDDIVESGKRLLFGLFKKFAIADLLAMVALNATNALQVHSAGWAWVLLYAFALQIYFDFSGYTDIAIGLGRLLGISLPENFNAPYLKPNLTQFWNNWHMTLTQWFRAYFFNPLTRVLRSGKKSLPIPVIIFFTQLATMVLIGLWHGVTLNFVAWGMWHGLGLFVHNRWSELTRAHFTALSSRWQSVLNVGGLLLTFNFVALGWVFFALPNLTISTNYLRVLFGLA
jgi:D-alanyl-lipoteichoic acid acyltransferase DltB (MBOAT superfamily)